VSNVTQTPIYVFIGPPGSGKGSLASLCQQRHGWETLSTGNVCRSHIASQTEIGKEIDFCIKSGKLIHDRVIVQMVQQWLYDNLTYACGVIFDGFPRTQAQAEALDALLMQLTHPCQLRVVELTISDETVIQRLTQRRICSNQHCQAVYTYADTSLAPARSDICDTCDHALQQREDDAHDVVVRRLQTYHETAEPLLAYYREKPAYIGSVAANQSLEQVYTTFIALTQRTV